MDDNLSNPFLRSLYALRTMRATVGYCKTTGELRYNKTGVLLKPVFAPSTGKYVIPMDIGRGQIGLDAGTAIVYYVTGSIPEYCEVRFKNGNKKDLRWNNISVHEQGHN